MGWQFFGKAFELDRLIQTATFLHTSLFGVSDLKSNDCIRMIPLKRPPTGYLLSIVTICSMLRLLIMELARRASAAQSNKRKTATTNKKMKRSKLGILAILALGGLMACGPVALAQDKPATPPPAGGDTAPPPRGGGRGAGLQAILDKLDLTADQKEKVKPILAGIREKMQALRDDTALSREDRMAKIKEINDAAAAKLKDILTADQYTKFEELRKQMAPGRRRQGADATTPAPTPPKN
jgi:protein CpxP